MLFWFLSDLATEKGHGTTLLGLQKLLAYFSEGMAMAYLALASYPSVVRLSRHQPTVVHVMKCCTYTSNMYHVTQRDWVRDYNHCWTAQSNFYTKLNPRK